MSELSDQQKEFCRLVSLGKSGREAYASAYDCDLKSAAASASIAFVKYLDSHQRMEVQCLSFYTSSEIQRALY